MWKPTTSPNTKEECAGYFIEGRLIVFVHFGDMEETHPLWDYFADKPF